MTHPTRRRGFTLLEMMLAISLLVLLCAFMFAFYASILRARQRGSTAIESTQLARVVAQRIAEEIRGASNSLTGTTSGISGLEHEITLNTIVLTDDNLLQRRSITDKPLQPQCDIREIRYYLAYNPEKQATYPDGTEGFEEIGLVRREVRTPRQPSIIGNRREEVDTDLLAKELRFLRFRYFDGVDWLKKWDLKGQAGQNALPQAVEVTVGYTPLPPEDPAALNFEDEQASELADPLPYNHEQFAVVVRVPLADTFFGSRLMRAQGGMGGGSLFGGPGGNALGGGGKFSGGFGADQREGGDGLSVGRQGSSGGSSRSGSGGSRSGGTRSSGSSGGKN